VGLIPNLLRIRVVLHDPTVGQRREDDVIEVDQRVLVWHLPFRGEVVRDLPRGRDTVGFLREISHHRSPVSVG
jgi:hypothetical protein